MQKIINALAVGSAVVSLTVVGLAGYVYVRKDAIIENIKEKALGGILGGGLPGGSSLPIGTPDLPAPSDQASGGGLGLPVPGSPL
tara:strand:- start:909 stop:1163 length:255 start_codon:yes stop_codon:yes gene_type:complete